MNKLGAQQIIGIDHTPTAQDMSGLRTVFVQYNPASKVAFSRRGILDRYTNIFIEFPVSSLFEITPSTATVTQGNTQQFGAVSAITGEDVSVNWSIVGSTDPYTTIDQNGLLTVGADESVGDDLFVKATLSDDSTQYRLARISVESAGFNGVLFDINSGWYETPITQKAYLRDMTGTLFTPTIDTRDIDDWTATGLLSYGQTTPVSERVYYNSRERGTNYLVMAKIPEIIDITAYNTINITAVADTYKTDGDGVTTASDICMSYSCHQSNMGIIVATMNAGTITSDNTEHTVSATFPGVSGITSGYIGVGVTFPDDAGSSPYTNVYFGTVQLKRVWLSNE